ncbi:MAG: hypothetical protein KF851_02135 [Pirellulaceae bacterium]|jgi:hypothetical protein|nr:hypothetical protein [Pirellulaceae bacterium]
MKSNSLVRQIWRFGLTIAMILIVSNHLLAQGGGGGNGQNPGTGTGGQGNNDGGQGTGTQGPGGFGSEQTQGGQRQGSQEFSTDLNFNMAPITFDDRRNIGFVGPSLSTVQEVGFVGANSVSLSGGGGGQGANRGANGLVGRSGLGGSLGGVGNQTTYQVNRSSIRTPLTNLISAPLKPDSAVAASLLDRIQRNPKIPKNGYQLSVQDRKVTITGSLSPQEADRLIRQLRLEPSIDDIIDQLQRD